MVFMQMKQFIDSRVNIWNLCSIDLCCTTHEESRVAHQCWMKLGAAGTENNNRIFQVYAGTVPKRVQFAPDRRVLLERSGEHGCCSQRWCTGAEEEHRHRC